MTEEFNLTGIKELYKRNAIARDFLDHAAQRERDRTETTAERTIAILADAGRKISRGDAIDLFRRLEELGCGQFVIGRRGAPSRFVWAVGIVSVGKAAAGESQTVDVIPETPIQTRETVNHLYHLRPDRQITLELPIDLTSREAERLAAFIRTLPMNTELSL